MSTYAKLLNDEIQIVIKFVNTTNCVNNMNKKLLNKISYI